MNNLIIFVVSDSIGETAELVAKAAASQFSSDAVEIRRVPHVTDIEQVAEIAVEAKRYNSLIIYTLATEKLRLGMEHFAQENGIEAVDVLSSTVTVIGKLTGLMPHREVGRLRQLDDIYFRRVAAMEFAVKYDDGKDPRGFQLADIVVLGVSRTSKTPVCMYLAHKNIKAANLPLLPEVAVPEVLFQLPKKKIFGLTIKPQTLNEIRQARLLSMGLAPSADYANPNRLLAELEYAEKIYKRLGCRVLDITNKAIEETAANILEIYNKEAIHDY